eukprot:XP_002262543.1 hypothetical protein, conserved in Plasmodium species [Plasmodium knowlesi strain H]
MFEEMKQPPDKSTNCINSKKEKAKQLFLQALNHERDENYLKATKFYQEAVKLYPNETTQREQNVYMINILTENFLGIINSYTVLHSRIRVFPKGVCYIISFCVRTCGKGDLFCSFGGHQRYQFQRVFLFSCKEIHSHVSVESEYKRLCDRNFQNCEEKSKALLLEYPRIRHDGVYISCVTDRVIYNPCVVTYFRYLLFINESNKVLVMRSEVNKKEVLEALKISYNKIRSWDLSVPSHDLIKSLIKFQGETENGLVKMVRIGEYTFKESEKVIEISYPESLSEPLKYKNIIQLRLKNYLSANNNMLKWMSFKILSQLKLSSSEDTLNINNRQYRWVWTSVDVRQPFLSHLFITKIPET